MAEPTLKVFDPKQYIITLGKPGFEQELTGFGPEKMRVRRESNIADDEAGADLEVVVVLTNDRRASITLPLLQSSNSNKFLSDLANEFELTGLAILNFLAKDLLGNEVISAPTSWVMTWPEVVRRKGVEMNPWVIRTSNLIMNIGGSDAV